MNNKKTSLSLTKDNLREFNLTKSRMELLLGKPIPQEKALLYMILVTNQALEALGKYALVPHIIEEAK